MIEIIIGDFDIMPYIILRHPYLAKGWYGLRVDIGYDMQIVILLIYLSYIYFVSDKLTLPIYLYPWQFSYFWMSVGLFVCSFICLYFRHMDGFYHEVLILELLPFANFNMEHIHNHYCL